MEQKAGVACVAALLLLAGVVGIILLAGPNKDVRESPDYKVKSNDSREQCYSMVQVKRKRNESPWNERIRVA